MEAKLKEWQESYSRGEHSIVFPKEECVKFLSRFVRAKKHNGPDIIKYEKEGALTGLDFGCGIGTQTQLMHQFGINAHGVDIVELAISRAKHLYPDISSFFQVIPPGSNLPFNDNDIDIVICEAVLDSMTFDLAKKAISELNRVSHGLTFISLIGSTCNHEGQYAANDEIVCTAHEEGTVQSYYDQARINALIADTQYKIVWQSLHSHQDNTDENISNARYYIVMDNR